MGMEDMLEPFSKVLDGFHFLNLGQMCIVPEGEAVLHPSSVFFHIRLSSPHDHRLQVDVPGEGRIRMWIPATRGRHDGMSDDRLPVYLSSP